MKSRHLWLAAVAMIILGLAACGRGEEADTSAGAEEAEASPGAEEATMSATAGEESADETRAEVEQPKNFMLIQFVEPIREADLEWLGENGFHVDTILGETTLRGWLELPEGGEVIGTDPRIAKIDAMMR